DTAAGEVRHLAKKIDRLLVYFQIAQQQDWVKSLNWLILAREYKLLGQEAGSAGSVGAEGILKNEQAAELGEKEFVSHNIWRAKKPMVKKRAESSGLSSRQKRIMQELKSGTPLKTSQLVPLFAGKVSERTLRNDLQELLMRGLIRKNGFKKTAVYLIK
ncbi:MAG: hypothetical protein LiPW39_404, partial [Parcubacteria group bacterium LiPW_39]